MFKEIRWFENKTLVQNTWLEDEHQFVDLKSLFPSFQSAQICYWKFTLLSSKDSNFTISYFRESILNLIQTKFVLRKFVIYISWTCTWTTSIKEGVINYKCDLWETLTNSVWANSIWKELCNYLILHSILSRLNRF